MWRVLRAPLADCPHLRLAGIFTHFASSEEFTHEKTDEQRRLFETTLEKLRELKIEAPLVHMANSAAVVSRPETWGHYGAAGLILYGPSPVVPTGGARRRRGEIGATQAGALITRPDYFVAGYSAKPGSRLQQPLESLAAFSRGGDRDWVCRWLAARAHQQGSRHRARAVRPYWWARSRWTSPPWTSPMCPVCAWET